MISLITQITLFSGVILLVILLAVKLARRAHLQVAVCIWGVVITAISYYLANSLGASDLRYDAMGLSLPWYSVAPLTASLALASTESHLNRLQTLLAFAAVAILTSLSNEGYVVVIANLADTDPVLLLAGVTMMFCLCMTVLAPMSFFWKQGETLMWSIFKVTSQQIRAHWKVLLIGCGWFVLAYSVTNVWVEGNIANLYLIKAPGTFLRDALFTTFYLVLIRHFVFIAFAKYVIEVLFPEEPTSMGEILLFACLLAGFQYYLPIGLIVREFLFGLIFGYWYLKTRSLSYGIVLRSLSMILT